MKPFNNTVLVINPAADYALLDSGEGEKLERFGAITLVRPDPQALWPKSLESAEWKKADGSFARDENKGGWSLKKNVPASWDISIADLKFRLRPTAFKHVGLFPEQAPNWEWMREQISRALKSADKSVEQREAAEIEVLNLFGYTGAASLACAQAGAKVVHVDGSKVALTWARENAELSGLEKRPIRWILDDARAFVRREVKRGRKYQGIIMDPPTFGHGPENEVWKIETDLIPLIEQCFTILADKPLFFVINGYASGYSALAYENILKKLVEKYGGTIEKGELAILEENKSARLLPCGIFARWSA